MSSVDMALRSFAQEVHANFMESLMVMSRALSRPTMGAKELCSWSTLSTRLAKLLREDAIGITRMEKLLLCIAFIWFSSIDGRGRAVTSVPRCPFSEPTHQGAATQKHHHLVWLPADTRSQPSLDSSVGNKQRTKIQ